MKKILGSIMTLSIVTVIGVVATNAFFSDTETSNNNTFTAGSIDLKVDAQVNESANDLDGFVLEATDLEGAAIFTYTDLKPGDTGDGFLSIHGASNDYWACTRTTNPVYSENTVVESETGDTTPDEGELQKYVRFAFWNDLNENGVWDPGVDANLVGPWLEGTQPWIPVGLYTVPGLAGAGWLPLADTSLAAFFSEDPLVSDSTHHLGYAYCFGDFVYDDGDDTFTCEGSEDDQNDAQTDGISSTMEFYAVQSRNNEDFLCSSLPNGTENGEPVVDGVISDGEYEGALTMSITDTGGGTVKAKTQGGFLYLAADILSDTTDNRVCCGFNDEFGVNLGESPATDTVFLGLGSTNANGRTFGPTDGLYSNFNPAGHTIMSLFGTGHRVIEWKIPLSSIPGIVNGDTLSIGGATESTDGNSVVYPIGLLWGNNATYGQLLVTP